MTAYQKRQRACPFCGSDKLTVDSKKNGHPHRRKSDSVLAYTHTASIRCNKCHARGPTVSVSLAEHEYGAVDMLKDKAFEAWEKRI